MSKRKGYSCPVCDKMFSKELLEEHVDQHFSLKKKQEQSKKCVFKGCNLEVEFEEWEDHILAHKMFDVEENGLQGTASKDALLAKALQQEETEENIQNLDADAILAKSLQDNEDKLREKEDFENLQQQYGMSSQQAGGYSKQFNDNMQRDVGKKVTIGEYFERKSNMMCAMITGEDSNETRTTGMIPFLTGVYACGMSGIARSFLCSECDHYSADVSDKGWGCGYRNIQMLWSSLLKIRAYKELIAEKTELSQVPSIPRLQTLIENAWKDGFDVSGQEQLGGRLSGTKKWIGATEVTTLFRWMGIKARIVDFHKATRDNTHPLLFEWVENYFKKNLSSQGNAFPLYLQHDGHSRTVIGMEEHNGGAQPMKTLLLFDPSTHRNKMNGLKNLKLPCSKTQTKDLRKSLKQMRHSQFQMVFIDGIYGNPEERNASKVLSSIRISRGPI